MGINGTSRARLVDTIGVLAVVFGMVLGLVPGIVLSSADAEDTVINFADFEIDGDLADANDDGSDWSHYPGARNPDDGIGNGDASWFTPSTREEDYPNWTFKVGGNTPKADLVRSYLQTQLAPGNGNSWVALATTRDADNGNAQVTVEFSQSNVTSYSGAFRTAGDFYIRFNFPGNVGNDPLTPEEVVAAINVRYAIWNGSAFGPEQILDEGTDPAVRAAIGSLDAGDPDALTFIELIIDLDSDQLGDLLGDGCTSFGAAGFRTEATGGNQNNDNTTLKDVIQPFPIDLNTCAPITVEKLDAEGNPVAGAEFTLYSDEARTAPVPLGDGVEANPCTTDATGTCTFGIVEPGTYYVDETAVPTGYDRDPVLDVLADHPAGYRFTVEAEADVTLAFTDPRIPYTIDVSPENPENSVDFPDHVFTVTICDEGDALEGPNADGDEDCTGADDTPLDLTATDGDGALLYEAIDLSWTGAVGSITDVDGGGAAATCRPADGTCDVTVTSTDPGAGTLTADWTTPYQNAVTPDPASTTTGAAPDSSITDSGTKVWIGFRAEIAADGLNLVGQPHTFTATVYEVDGTPPDELAAGVDVTFEWSAGTAAGSGLDALGCTTGADGTCTVTATDGGTPGTGTISIVELDGTVGDDEALTVTFDAGEVAATKTWREYRATIDDDSVNPSGEDHTFTVTIEYRDDESLAWAPAPDGTTVSGYSWTGDGSVVEGSSTCLTTGTAGGTGQCTVVVSSAAPGSGTLAVTEVAGALIGDAGEVDETFTVADEATKTWLDFEVDILPDGDNLVGESHTFTISVERYDGTSYQPIVDGSVVTFELTDPATYVSDTCSSTIDGQCTVTVTSATAGAVTLTATGLTGYGEFDTPADVTFDASNDTDEVSDDATKTWWAYRASIEADGVNLVGDEHVFTITAEVDDGTGWTAVQDGTTVTFAVTGAVGGVTEVNGAPDVDATSCQTTGGTCTVTVDSATPGDLTVTVQTVENLDATDSAVTAVDVSSGADLPAELSVSADKTWIAYRADIEADAINLTGDEHVFTVTAEQNDGSGWAPVPAGTVVGFSTDNPGTVQAETCSTGTDAEGQCTITVNSTSVDDVTVTVTTVAAADVDGDPIADVTDDAASKDWIAVLVDVEADATNIVGDPHTFTVDVDIVTPDGTVPAPDGTTVTFGTSGAVGQVASEDCTTGTAGGGCEITVTSADAGALTVTVESVTFAWTDGPFTVDFTDGSSSGEAPGQDLSATKTWRDYRTSIEADGLNLTGDDHTFTVTVEQSDDGVTWVDVPDGTVANVSISGTGSIVVDDCVTIGTVAGTCDVTVGSDTPGTATVTVESITVDDPGTVLTAAVDTTVDTADSEATKTWIAFRPLVSDDSVNVTGDAHDFTLTVEWTVDGVTWNPVPDGSTIGYESTGVGAVDDDDCDGTVDGSCTVTVVSDVSGERSVTVTDLSVTVVLGQFDVDFTVTFEDGQPGTITGLNDATATKTWASYTLELTPVEALNLVPGDEDHVITAILTSDDAENAPVGGQPIAVTLSGDTGTIVDVENLGSIAADGLSAVCVTGDDGTCDITISSAVPGTATLSGTFEATVGESEPITVESNEAVKVWTTFRLTVTPEQATNLVGNAHVFTVLVEQSVPDADCADPVDGWCPEAAAFPTIGIVDSSGSAVVVDDDCGENGTGADGTCTVTVNSDEVTAITLTATYEASIGQTTAAFSDSGDKTWIDYAISVTPDEDENLVGTEHTFTVRISTDVPGDGVVITQPVAGAVPLLDLAGNGAILFDQSTCDEGTDEFGECTVVITSGATGSSTLTATYLGTAADDEEVREYVDSGDKLWVDYDLVLDADATNAVGDPHTFTATLTRDEGDGFLPVVGAVVDVAPLVGVGTLADETCSTGTDADGQCTITIESDETGTTTVAVEYEGVAGETAATFGDDAVKTWVDIALVKQPVVGDGVGDGDLTVRDGLPTLTFVDTDLSTGESYEPQTAVYEFTITNPGPVTLFAITLVDDRIGVVLDGSEGVSLAPGESTTVRASETFTQDQVDEGALVTNQAVATGTTVDEVTVDDDADAVIQLVSQLGAVVDIALEKQALTGTGDLLPDPDIEASGGIVQWFGDDIDDNATKAIPYQYTIRNTGSTLLTNIVLTDDKIGTLLDGSEGIVLGPGESYALVVTQEVSLVEVFALVDEPDIAFDLELAQQSNSYANGGLLPNVATVTATDDLGNPGPSATAEELVRIVALKDVVTGFDQGLLLPLALLLMVIGTMILVLNRRFGRQF